MKTIFTILLALLSLSAKATQYDPPYIIDWTVAGVPGGIPTGQTTFFTIASTNDTTDRATAIQAKLDTCPVGQKVVLGAGVFYFDTMLTIPTGVILSGTGAMQTGNTYQTVMYPRVGGSAAIYAGKSGNTPPPGPFVGDGITSSVVAGTTVLTISSTGGYTVGDLVRVSCANQNNNAAITAGAVPVIMDTGFFNSRTHLAKLISKTATTLTISPGLYWDMTGLSPIAQAFSGSSSGVGVQNLTIDCTAGSPGTPGYAIWFQSCFSSWIKDVRVEHAASFSLFFLDCFQNTITHNYCNIAGTGGPNGGGILFGTNGVGGNSCLVYDNIIVQCYPSIEVNYGSCGNVFSYNFCYDNTLGDSSVGPSIDTNHGPHNSFNLYESNYAANVEADGFFGGCSEDTLFRNWLTSTSPGAVSPRTPVLLKRFTRRYAMVGNLLGTSGQNVATYEFGLPNIGNTAFTGTVQPTLGTFWADWNLHGTLTTRTNATDGVITATGSIGSIETGANLMALTWPNGIMRNLTVSGIAGLAVSFSAQVGTLPTVSTAMNIWPGVVDTYQEKDLDVQPTTTLKGNYNTQDGAIPAGESLGGQTLANSLYLSAKPDWFGFLTFPAYDSSAPNFSGLAIPAGYRYTYGVDPPANLVPAVMGGSVKIGGAFNSN